jgi:endogenous inhibitor of DNA gyrase (YacG/DUF329 family)
MFRTRIYLKPKVREVKCELCGQTVKTLARSTKYCSHECRLIIYKAKYGIKKDICIQQHTGNQMHTL